MNGADSTTYLYGLPVVVQEGLVQVHAAAQSMSERERRVAFRALFNTTTSVMGLGSDDPAEFADDAHFVGLLNALMLTMSAVQDTSRVPAGVV